MPVNIKNISQKKIWLAPLAGFTDFTFRSICKECGADVVVSEMISSEGFIFNRERSLEYAKFSEYQRPFGIQLFGAKADIMQQGAEIALQEKPDFLDINMGCPVKKVIKKGAGSALMQHPEEAEKIVQKVKLITEKANIPLSVKIRAGWDNFSINAVEFGKRIEAAGADLICLHPRTRSQMFAGKSNWNLIAELKKAVRIPVVGNGDVLDLKSAIQMFEQTGCDSIMIGRGILGNPWLFSEIVSFLKNGKIIGIPIEKKLKIIRKHIDLSAKEKGNERALVELRSHFAQYTKGLRGGAKVRDNINRCFDFDEIYQAIEKLFEQNIHNEMEQNGSN
jgi:tRNA-dihydrouridine synthase B